MKLNEAVWALVVLQCQTHVDMPSFSYFGATYIQNAVGVFQLYADPISRFREISTASLHRRGEYDPRGRWAM